MRSRALFVIFILSLYCLNVTGQTIVASQAYGTIAGCESEPSAMPFIKQFTVSGSGLASPVIVTVSGFFELSLSQSGNYSGSISLMPSNGQVLTTTVYVRSSALANTGVIAGQISISSAGAATQTLPVSGVISVLPTVDPVSDQTVAYDTFTQAVHFTGSGNTFYWTNDQPSIGLPSGGVGDIPSFQAINTGSKPVTATITVIPQNAGQLFMLSDGSVSLPSKVVVFNSANNKETDIVNAGAVPAYIEITPDNSKVYIGNAASNTVTVLDALSHQILATTAIVQPITAFNNITALALSHDGQKGYVANLNAPVGGYLSVIDLATNVLLKTANINTLPYALAVSADNSLIYAGTSSSEILTVDAGSLNVLNTTTVDAAVSALKISPDGKTLYAILGGSKNVLAIYDLPALTLRKEIPVGANAPALALSPDGSNLYVSEQATSSVAVVNTSDGTQYATITLPNVPSGICASPDGQTLYAITDENLGYFVISTGSNSLTTTVKSVHPQPDDIGDFAVGGTACLGLPVTFTITVTPPAAPIVAPNAFTPNGDGINDTWNLKNIDSYPGCTVAIFNRLGERLFYSNNYPVAWDGKFKGSPVPAGTYYYIIDPKNGKPPLSGYVAVIR